MPNERRCRKSAEQKRPDENINLKICNEKRAQRIFSKEKLMIKSRLKTIFINSQWKILRYKMTEEEKNGKNIRK